MYDIEMLLFQIYSLISLNCTTTLTLLITKQKNI